MKIKIILFLFLGIIFHPVYSDSVSLDSLFILSRDENVRQDQDELFDVFYEISFQSNQPIVKGAYADSAYYIAVLQKSNNHKAAALVLKSRKFLLLRDLASALEVLHEANNLYIEGEYIEGRGVVAYLLADVYLQSGDYYNSENCFETAEEMLLSCNDTMRLAGAIMNLGELYRSKGEVFAAILKFNRSYVLFDKIKYSVGCAYSLGNKGLAQIDILQLDSAKVNLELGLEILEPMEDKFAISSFQEGLARVYLNERNYREAIKYANSSFSLAEADGLKEQMRDASLCLANIYNAQNKYDKAYAKHCEYVTYRDSINNEDTVRKMADLRTKYEVAQKQKEVDELVNQKQKYVIIGISLFVILTLLLSHVAYLYRIRKLRKRDAKELEKQHAELQVANDTKNKFFSILSHDLRSPIATFNSYSEVLNYYLESNDYDQIPELAKELERSSSSVVQLLDNLLQWGVIQMESININLETVTILQVFKEELIHIQPIADSKDIHIQSNIASDISLYIDKPFFAMALRNLISNSLKFTNVGGFITISAFREFGKTIVKVADTGVGLDAEEFKKRLCQGEMVSTYGTNNEKGLGLGMQLVCSFVEMHNAEIDVESILGKGTTFILKFNNEAQP